MSELADAMPGVNRVSLSCALLRLVSDGRLVQPRRGSYAVAEMPREASRDSGTVRRHVLALPPGSTFDHAEVRRGTGVVHVNVAGTIHSLVRGGHVVRIARGTYARGGAVARVDGSHLSRYSQVLRIMSGREGPWRSAEVQAALHDTSHGKEAAWLLNNMVRSGLVERVAQATWVISTKGRESLLPGVHVEPAEILDACLPPGRLMTARELQLASGLPYEAIALGVDRLEASGRITHVAYGAWRRSSAPAPMESCAGLRKVMVLGRILAEDGPYGTEQFVRDHGHGPNRDVSLMSDMVGDGVLRQVGRGLRETDPSWRVALRARLDTAGVRPPLTPLGARMAKALRDAGPLRKSEIASRVGTNRGVAIRMVDRLVEEGRMVEVGPGRFMLG